MKKGCAGSLKAMHGTRDAAHNWETENCEFMSSCGFARGNAHPCVFHHEERDVQVVVHGDDFTCLGHDAGLDWYRSVISEKV